MRDVRPPRSLRVDAVDMHKLLAMCAPETHTDRDLIERLTARLAGRPISDGEWRTKEQRRSREQAARPLGTSGRTIGRVKRVIEIMGADAEIVHAVDAGQVTIVEAERQAVSEMMRSIFSAVAAERSTT